MLSDSYGRYHTKEYNKEVRYSFNYLTQLSISNLFLCCFITRLIDLCLMMLIALKCFVVFLQNLDDYKVLTLD